MQINHVTGLRLGLVVVSVTLVAFLMLLDMSIIVTVSMASAWRLLRTLETTDSSHSQAIPHITAQFHSLGDVGWYGSAYLLSR
jgi:5-bromo-4-chloroindolyl phosphate hydrolysis protein